ncbi:MAG: hypothetical protein ACP6IP_05140 [Candidatus Njordarchaeia archaeon]
MIDEEFYKNNRNTIEKNLIFSTASGIMGSKPKLDKEILNLLKKKFRIKEKKEDLSDIFL